MSFGTREDLWLQAPEHWALLHILLDWPAQFILPFSKHLKSREALLPPLKDVSHHKPHRFSNGCLSLAVQDAELFPGSFACDGHGTGCGVCAAPAGTAAQQPRPGEQAVPQGGGARHTGIHRCFHGSRLPAPHKLRMSGAGQLGRLSMSSAGAPNPGPAHLPERRSRAEVREERGRSVFSI